MPFSKSFFSRKKLSLPGSAQPTQHLSLPSKPLPELQFESRKLLPPEPLPNSEPQSEDSEPTPRTTRPPSLNQIQEPPGDRHGRPDLWLAHHLIYLNLFPADFSQ